MSLISCNNCKCKSHLQDAACDCECHWNWEQADETVEVGMLSDEDLLTLEEEE